jgi:8-oxo-dGTP pyrophosphatase MutT (NUDIX family)
MTFSHRESIDVRHITINQPFYAGVILIQQGRLIITLHTDNVPTQKTNQATAYRVMGPYGSQEAGETIWECAIREAKEKLRIEVQLRPSPIMYFHEVDTGEINPVSCTDAVPPLLLERQSNLYPYVPLRRGLPVGPYSYFGVFLTQPLQSITQSDNVEGILSIPLNLWPALLQQPALETILQQGATLLERTPLPRQRQLWVHPGDAFTMAVSLLQKHPELL